MFDLSWQGSLLGWGAPAVDPTFAGAVRTELDPTSWVEHVPGWLRGADDLLARLVAGLPWQQRTVVMFGRLVAEPRLTWWGGPGDPDEPVLGEARRLLGVRYGRRFASISANLYRDGADSVAWHRDRIRHTGADPVVAIVSLGQPRPFLLRPHGGGPVRRVELGGGDLFVMGGACQTDWEHTVPKVARAGVRLSVMFREQAEPPERVPGLATVAP